MPKPTKSRRKRSSSIPLWIYLLMAVMILPIPLLAYQIWHSATPAVADRSALISSNDTPSDNSSSPTAAFFDREFAQNPNPDRVPPPIPQVCTNPPAPVTRCVEESPKKYPLYNACFGHLPYPEAPRRELVSVGQETLRSTAAQKYREMVNAARQAGVRMYDISGFRDIATQNYLFYEIAAQRGQSYRQRSLVSAPPGFSEHHTGYAIDIGDANDPSTELKESFERTRVFAWLVQNAEKYGFELSFRRGNVQKIAYEPWHWRFVGDSTSQQVFAVAQQCLNIKS
jgi:D-alanyl-D-alanine carboxypeptidase